MDFQPTAEMERIRSEIRASLAAALPDDWQGSGFLPMDVRPEHMELARSLDRRLASKQLLAPAWPEEFGGRTAEELALHVRGLIAQQLEQNAKEREARTPA